MEQNYEIGYEFYEDENYSDIAKFCNDSPLEITIEEIESDDDTRRKFKIVEVVFEEIPLTPEQELENKKIMAFHNIKLDIPEIVENTEDALCELGDLADMNSIAAEDLSDAAVELGDLVDESVNTNIDLIDAVTELGDLVAEQADTIAQLQQIIEQLTSGE